jgi:uncharacterized integral membrane protein
MRRIMVVVLAILVLLAGATFTYRNSQLVELNYYFGIQWLSPLSFMLLTFLAIGAIIGFLSSLAMVARMQRALLDSRRENRDLVREVNNLRALPIRDVP